ncbi:DUF4145 domain-containing protein [Carnobacterium maltaromaticum]|uniref:DUF4145 domain-containing protein n=1 Tax=Carnobacterium maltaromaticum TaxID=2751 RepID=A0AAW9JYK9_CARML|nr:DUF4145 domain-containing protein [Carnobacterium maltaromaticum]MDZ5758715.1 DUF4145 domain-containing protein [Carnobacterium maltaromaticum]
MSNFDFDWESYNKYSYCSIETQPAFICPQCELLAAHSWAYSFESKIVYYEEEITELIIESSCLSCSENSYWKINELGEETLLYPIKKINTPKPPTDMPKNVQKTYKEAFTILNDSPRASTALARLAVEELLTSLEVSGNNINEQIGNLVRDGLSSRVQKPLDALRVIGNNAVHPGKIEDVDNADSAKSILELLNFIVEELITKPKEIESIYASLPKGVLEAIEKRDSK